MTIEEMLLEMDARRANTLTVLEKIAMDEIVYPESAWRVQDVIAHITHWEEQSLLTLDYARRGERYYLPNFRELGIDGFNAVNVEQHRNDTALDVINRFEAVRSQFKALVAALNDSQWSSSMRWLGQDATPQQMIEGILWHEDHHLDDVIARIPQQL